MQKKFITNLALLLFLNLLVKPFWILGIDRSVQNVVGAEDYGFYFTILNFSFLFSILLDLGITNFNNRNIAQNNHLLNKHFSGLVGLKIIIAALYLLVTFTVGYFIGYNSTQFKMLLWISFNQFLLSFLLYLRSNISGLLLFKTDSFLSILDKLLMILFCSILLWGNVTENAFQIEWFVYAQTAAYLISVIIASAIVIRKASFTKLNWNRAFLMMILKKSFPFALLVLVMRFNYKIDSVMIERLIPGNEGDRQVGIYAMAYRLLDASHMFAFLFAGLLLPIFSNMLKHKEPIEKMVQLSLTLLIIISSILAIGSFFYNHEIINLLYTQHFDENTALFQERLEEASIILQILMFSFIAISSSYVFGTLLTANNNMKHMNIIAIISMVLGVALNLVMIPKLQATGAAYASLASMFSGVIMQIIAAKIIFRFNFNYKYIGKLTLFIGGVFVFNFLSKKLSWDWMVNFMIMATASVLLAFVLRFLNLKELYYQLKPTKDEPQ
jgi:O-antigen/teichoic acid export membrane protein